ncbi:MAG: 16S rRNA (cytidine(1402)-2'-O)-methyltransferase [Lachnospiraceae bacterium]|nr:16S rRNA (cytidine(1402)-2'-O)-methyltransferase [Lachnospiraceae bacterium]
MDIEAGLYLCPTPIGNLGDITIRTLEVLRSVDMIAAEDTRNTLKLLNHFDIKGNLTSYHEHNRYEKADYLIGQILSGKSIALVTDAGMPAISDPGEVLVKRCIEENIYVTSLPGACAAVTAVTVSGFDTGRFLFEGFLPADKVERDRVLSELKNETGTLIFYEAPHRLKKTVAVLYEGLGNRRVAFCRELTKLHEQIVRMELKDAAGYFEKTEPRGEYVLVVEGRDKDELLKEKREEFKTVSVTDRVRSYVDGGMDKKEAMRAVARERGVSKRDIYNALLKEEE